MGKQTVKWSDIRVLTFDCYGTLVDWEKGILEELPPILQGHGIHTSGADLLELYAGLEQAAEQGPYQDYKSVLRTVMDGIAAKFQFQLRDTERDCLVCSLNNWPLFSDTIESLKFFKSRFKLAVISNTDDDLFALTRQQLGIDFDWVVTAEQVKSYKPSLNNFRTAFRRIGVPSSQILHVAQSMYHDIAPANQLGLSCAWVNRRQGQEGSGATPQEDAIPDIVVRDLQSLVKLFNL